IFGLHGKGRLEKGSDADIVLVDTGWKGKIHADRFQSKAKYSPFEDFPVQGRVHTTIVNGKIVYEDGEIVGRPGSGRILVGRGR
ncbi:MAG TPA: amidohydrolase family protein, partial [Candidatus Binatus sp.]|nr:amidohydrolase family protein [Candidatus Binatus sp.]